MARKVNTGLFDPGCQENVKMSQGFPPIEVFIIGF